MSADERSCRTCLVEAEDLRSLFRSGKICGELTTLANMLQECTPLKAKENDLLPQQICGKCVLSLSKSYIFRRNCLNSDSLLRERIKSEGAEEEEVIGTLYFYDETEAENSIEDVTEQVQYVDDEIPPLKQEQSISDINSTGEEEEEALDESYEHVSESYTVSQFDEDNPQVQAMFTVELQDSTKDGASRKQRKRMKRIPGPPFKCDMCTKVLSNHSSYKYHMQLHSDKTPFLCSECGQGFKTRNAYDGHMTTHDENNPNRCNVCGKVYRQAGSLRCHLLTHTGEKPFVCNICGKGMTQKSGFKKHMLTHTGEKPHTCDICGNSFRFSSNLITHRRRHTGEKPYVCTTCGKAFVGGEQLKRHIAIHTGEKLYECNICQKIFNRRSTMQVHRQQHTPGKSFPCGVCKKAFSTGKGLVLHMNTHKEVTAEMKEDIEEMEEVEQEIEENAEEAETSVEEKIEA